MKQLAAVAVLIALFGASPSAAPSASPPAGIVWNNVVLGAPASGLRSALGDPLRIVPFDNGNARVARYWVHGSNSTFFLVIERNGYVDGFEAFTESNSDSASNVPPDPSGVRLGDLAAAVKALHPDAVSDTAHDGSPELSVVDRSRHIGIFYDVTGGGVRAFHWGTDATSGLPQSAPISEPAGEDEASAILDVQPDEGSGVHWEYLFLAFHPCAEHTLWKLEKQRLLHDAGRSYDVLEVACPSTNAKRDYYFDITPFFGKI